MTQKQKISEIFERYILNRCTKEEIEVLVTYFQKSTGQKEMPTVEEVLELLNEQKQNNSAISKPTYQEVLKVAKEKESARKGKATYTIRWKKYVLVASIFVSALISGYLLWNNNSTESSILSPVDAITLELEDGNIEILELEGEKVIYAKRGKVIGKKTGSQLSYANNTNAVDKLVYNTLTVPYGKMFSIELSDGTNVKLNSGTRIKYPVKFIEGQNRLVYLSGEAFFHVSKDELHPFIVNDGQINTRVLGTRFNMSSYTEDRRTDVVLVEGAVGLYLNNEDYSKEGSVILKPGYMGSYIKNNKDITTRSVITGVYTSWMSGELIFRNMLFENILKKLERHFSVKIKNKNKLLENERFNASYGVVNIEKILEDFKITYGIKYIMEGNNIIIE